MLEWSSVFVFSHMVGSRYVIENRKENMLTCASDLIPDNAYPRQMSQGILAFEHLLDSGYKPSEVPLCHLRFSKSTSNIALF